MCFWLQKTSVITSDSYLFRWQSNRCVDRQLHIHLTTLDSSALEPCRLTTPRIKIIPHTAAIPALKTTTNSFPAFHSEGLIPTTLRSESFEGLKGVGDQKTVSWSALLRHYTEAASSCKDSAQRIMGARSVHQLYPSKSFNPKGPLKWLILSTSVWNDTSIWRPWLFSLRSALRRAIYPVWNAPLVCLCTLGE